MSYKESNIQFDAVIPWVNGNDTAWQKKINIYLDKKIDFKKKKDSKRYNSIGEIDIAIKSIIKNAPFFKTIYLVTDNQVPDTFEELKDLANKSNIDLKVIDHKIIFEGFEQFLPTFNSTSIINMLHKIPNLSEHYVLFNDDTFLLRKSTSNDFFRNSQPILRGLWKKYYEYQKLRLIYYKFFKPKKSQLRHQKGTLKKSMQYGAKLAEDGKKTYLRRRHTPISLRKSTLNHFFSQNNDLLTNNIKFKFRDNNKQFITETLANHLEIKNKSYFYTSNTKLTYFRSYKNRLLVKLKLFWFDLNKNKIFMTFQSLELADNKTQNYILKWIDNKLK